MRKYVLSAKLHCLAKTIKVFAVGAISLGTFNRADAQSWSQAINHNNGVLMVADNDNTNDNEDFIWVLDRNDWYNNSDYEKMRLSSARLRLNTAFSMHGYNEFIIDSAYGYPGMRFIIKPNGNVGIGNSNPLYRLHVNGNMRLENTFSMQGGYKFSIDSAQLSGRRLMILENGNVGINMPNPAYKLHVGGTMRLENSFSMAGAGSPSFNIDGPGEPGARFNVQPNGNVGIGKPAPEEKLDVNGNIQATGLKMKGITRLDSSFSMAGTPEFKIDAPNIEGGRFVVKTNGNVGIGTANPTKGKLEVVGSFHVANTAGHQTFHVSAGQQLVFVGDSAYIRYQSALSNPGSPIQNSDFSLWVSKGIVTEDLAFADVDEWDDYVFNTDYKLPALDQVAAFIKANKHLPGIPSEKEVKQFGYSVHKLNRGLLKNLEELTLHAIGQEKKIKDLESEVAAQKLTIAQYETLAAEVAKLKAMLSTLSPSK